MKTGFTLAIKVLMVGLVVGMSIVLCGGMAQAVSVPDPFICMYGHHDGPGVTDQFREIIPPFTVIEGTSTDADFIKELRNQGRVYAAHVTNPAGESAAELVARWRAPFDDTLGGQLSGGYDAIAIDELHGGDTNGTAHSDAVCSALQQLRSLYPSKLIFAAATWHYGSSSTNYSDQLNAINAYTDVLMLEHYVREGNPQYSVFNTFADNIESSVPGLLHKTVFGLYVSQYGFVADDSTDRGFWGHIDEQFHLIKNDPEMSAMPGLMFWVYYRSETELTPDYVARLVDHYYIQNNTNYFGDGNYTQLITNPQFESGTSGWSLQVGTGGTVAPFSYGSVGFDNDHDDFGQASHGSQGLKMVKGSTPNEASFQVNGVNPSMVYTVSAWVMADVPSQHAKLTITQSDGTYIASKEIDYAGTGTQWNEWSRIIFNFVPTSSTIKVVLNDEPTAQGIALYWDFVELEEAYPADGPGPPPTYTISGTVTSGGQPMEGVEVTADGHSDTTAADGTCTIDELAAGTYTVTPSLAEYTFTPADDEVTLTEGAPEATGVDFVGTQRTYSI